MIFTSLILSLFVIAGTLFLRRRWNYDLHKIPAIPGLPLLANTLDFSFGQGFKNSTKWFGTALKKLNYPKLLRFEAMGQPFVLVTDDDFFKSVVMSKKDPFPRVVDETQFMLPMVGKNASKDKYMLLHTGVSPYVKAVRKVYSTAFQSGNLKKAMPRIQEVMNKMISVIDSRRENGAVEIENICVRTTLDSVGKAAFDVNLGGLDENRKLINLLLESGCIANEACWNPIKTLYYKYFPNSKAGRYRNAVVEKLRTEWTILKDEILSREDPSSGEEPLWYGLKHLADPETGEPVTQDLLLAEIATVVIGGMDSTGHQVAWILALLASRQDISAKILDELKQNGLYGDGAREIQFEDVAELSYLTAVIKEGLRVLYVITALCVRSTPRDMTILGYRVPKGTRLYRVGNRAFNMGADWSDPGSFQPERWLAEDELCHKWNMMFSTGPRDCPGQKLAMLEMRLIIITVLKNYDLSLVGNLQDLVENAATGLVIEAKGGIWLNMSPKSVA